MTGRDSIAVAISLARLATRLPGRLLGLSRKHKQLADFQLAAGTDADGRGRTDGRHGVVRPRSLSPSVSPAKASATAAWLNIMEAADYSILFPTAARQLTSSSCIMESGRKTIYATYQAPAKRLQADN